MPFALSRTKIALFLECPRCFWIDVRAKLRRPSGPPFSLNVAVDHLLKNEFDRYRGGTVVPPRVKKEGLAFIPAAHPDLPAWRHNFHGVRVEHARTIGTVLLQIGIVLELVAVALHERLSIRDLQRSLGQMTSALSPLTVTVLPGGRY